MFEKSTGQASQTGADPHKKRARAKSSNTGVDQHKRQDRVKPYFTSISFSQEHCNDKIAKMIILHDYPLHIVEHKGFNDFARALQPQFNPLSLNTVQGIVLPFTSERSKTF